MKTLLRNLLIAETLRTLARFCNGTRGNVSSVNLDLGVCRGCNNVRKSTYFPGVRSGSAANIEHFEPVSCSIIAHTDLWHVVRD
ncbi:hypothetical protein PMAYCL1PPCAC_16785 [Pristionchus mayeri]|uniref:Uncharacterized protein n=1 Tax=Pristionchus mayeri TaxID=1317129 RepID=A0AAN5HZQ5_9BILA|nr:hypothetical protein PMAYCL1PPCAC_16785 [Pristionchus mayeri]